MHADQKDIGFNIVMNILGALMLFLVLFVIWFVLIASISDPKLVARGDILFVPKHINFDAYITLINKKDVWVGYGNSILYMVVGTLINIVVTMFTAYPLTRRDFRGKGLFTVFFMITMYFSGGLIPTFLLIKNLGMYNTMWSLVIPGAVSVYNIIICRTYMQQNVPYEIQESAKIDGASDFTILLRLVFPMSGPIIAVLVMFFAIGHWNSFMGPLIYLKDRAKYPLQIFLSEILVKSQQSSISSLMTSAELVAAQKATDQGELLKYALVIVSSLPFMILYPFLQKYIVKGMVVGAIKG